ncbi:uncharacterized protein AB675_7397 [Cyphellophora attinorum]|uniref:SnoaL-like domain-containing protein n=1 Tax=Cyphellophora attinorum TaxID=1664694 RepID=A0A0N0NHC5_9EURO|nr:uncharacterized protein AB675_7397 [Phialophora attinorum]KPI34531.1 hypothetical protein AB675_7397 [Phialophora attinorum]
MATRDQLLATALEFVERIDKGESKSIIDIRGENCQHEVGPPCMGVAEPMSNEQYKSWWEEFVPKIWPNGMRFYLDSTRAPVIDERSRHVVLYCKSRASSYKGEYEGRYIMNLTISEDGKKVDDIVEFLDSKTALDYSVKALQTA